LDKRVEKVEAENENVDAATMVIIERLSWLRPWGSGSFGQVVEETLKKRSYELSKVIVSVLTRKEFDRTRLLMLTFGRNAQPT
jgi:hypothetical protein